MLLLLIYVLLFCLKYVGNCVLNLCPDIISLIAFHVFAALNLYLSKSCSYCNLFASQMFFLSITLSVFRLMHHVIYCAESGCNISCLYNLSLYLINLNRPFVIHFDLLCLY